MTRLAIVCTHPIQYLTPVFTALSQHPELQVKVFYGWRGATETSFDPGFGQSISWDIPLLEGYSYEFVTNIAKDPGSHHFRGIDLPSLCHRVTEWNANAVLVYGWCYKSHLAAMRFFKGRKPVLFRGDSTLLDETLGLKTCLRRLALCWVYRHVDVALAVGTHNRQYFRAHGLSESQIVHAPHAIDNDRFENTGHAAAKELRARLGISEESVTFVFPGKLETKKAPELLLESFVNLSNVDAHLLIAGSGPLENAMKIKAHKRVHFLGFQNQTQMPSIYRAADLVILPSRGPGETWGLALNEAMACGRAVLATRRVGAAIDLIEAGKNGWIIPAADVGVLKSALNEAIALGRSGLRAYGMRSSQIIRNWTVRAQAEAIAKAVLSVASEKQQHVQ